MQIPLRTGLVCWIAAAVTTAASASACTLCPPDLERSLWRDMDGSGAAVLAELVRRSERDASGEPNSEYRVTSVLSGGDAVAAGDAIHVPLEITSPIGAVHLFVRGTGHSEWGRPRGLSREERAFLSKASRFPVVSDETPVSDRVKRLAFALPYLASDEVTVAASAYAEFAAASGDVVQRLRPLLDGRDLMAWCERDNVTARNRRVLFLLLGFCRDSETLPFVRASFERRLAEVETADLDAVVATYLVLAGADALEEIDQRILNREETSLATKRAAARAIRFHVEHASPIDRDRLIASSRLLLADPRTADYVLPDLTRWKDWDSLEDVLKLRKFNGRESRWLRHPIREYLEACPRPAARTAGL